MVPLSDAAITSMVSNGELPDDVRNASARVAVVLTQSWCPEWLAMRRFLDRPLGDDLTVFYIEYDRSEHFHEIMAFKEGTFGNSLIPYLRYYRDGVLVAQSNAVYFKKGFLKRFDV